MAIASKAVPAERTDLWWVFLPIGAVWLVFALLVFQFDSTSVKTISILIGVTCIAAALLELATIPASHGWWRLGRLALAAGFAIVGIIAFADPHRSFEALATIFAFYLLLRGLFELVAGFALRGREDAWWVMLVVGFVNIALAFWAAGDFAHKAFLLLVWIGASALAHGLLAIVRAFALRPT
jgi:uncharacterized membrane protein HdeD (DUF308 family)